MRKVFSFHSLQQGEGEQCVYDVCFFQCSLGTVKLEVGRIKAGPFHSERRTSQGSHVSMRPITEPLLHSATDDRHGSSVIVTTFPTKAKYISVWKQISSMQQCLLIYVASRQCIVLFLFHQLSWKWKSSDMTILAFFFHPAVHFPVGVSWASTLLH